MHQPGQYSTLGLGAWEPRAPGCAEEHLEPAAEANLIRRAYSISCPVMDDALTQLWDRDGCDWLEFYIVLVRETGRPDPPALTPRLFMLREGDRLFMGEKIAGHFTLESNGELHLRQLHQPIPARRSRGRQRDDDVAIHQGSQKQSAQLRRIVATDCQRVSRFDPVLRQLAKPSITAVTELAKRPTLVVPNQRRSVPQRLQSPSQPMTAHDRPPLPLCVAIQASTKQSPPPGLRAIFAFSA